MTGCKLGVLLRKSGLQLLVAVLLDMQHTKLKSSNLQKVLEWKNALKDLSFMKFGVQFILDKIRAAAKTCIVLDDEFSRKIADLEREIAAKKAELALLLSQRDALMQSSSAGYFSLSGDLWQWLIWLAFSSLLVVWYFEQFVFGIWCNETCYVL